RASDFMGTPGLSGLASPYPRVPVFASPMERMMRVRAELVCCLFIAACSDATKPTSNDNDDLTISAAKGGGGGGGGGGTRINSITVAPPSATIQAGATTQLTATSKPSATATFTWSTSNGSVAT